jgi:hypothetical protein
MGGAHDDAVRTVPHGGEAHVTKAIGDELETPKVNGL